jgi:hypothetical protein
MEARFAKVNTKFLLGDKPSHYDILIGSSMTYFYQDNGDDCKMLLLKNGVKALLENGSYPKTKAFSDNYRAYIADYLAARPKRTN